MNFRSLTALGALVALGLAVAVPAVAFGDVGSTAVQAEPTDNESKLGIAITSFAQSTAVDAQSSAEQGLWQVQANATFEQNATGNETEELISDRAAELERRLQTLQNRTDRLERNRENLSGAAYNARASALRSQIANVRSAITQANQTAASRGVNMTHLDRLRNNAANLTGPEVAAIARNITDVSRGPPEGVPGPSSGQRGPPADRGPQAPGNASTGPSTPGAGNDAAGPGAGVGNDTTGPATPDTGNDAAGPPGSDTGAESGSDAGQSGAGDRGDGSDSAQGPQSDEQTTTSGSEDSSDDSSEDDSENSNGQPDNRGR